MKAGYWVHGGGQKVKYYARNATKVARIANELGMGRENVPRGAHARIV